MIEVVEETLDSQGDKLPDKPTEGGVWQQLMGKDIQLLVSAKISYPLFAGTVFLLNT